MLDSTEAMILRVNHAAVHSADFIITQQCAMERLEDIVMDTYRLTR
jgi:hypothetical protein